MRNYILFLPLLFIGLLSCNNTQTANKDNGVGESAPEEKVSYTAPEEVFSNEYVRVVKVSLEPGAAVKEHDAEERVIYSLSDYAIEWIENGKDQGTKEWSKGQVHAHNAGKHSAKNVGDTKAEWLAFIKVADKFPECEGYSSDNDVLSVTAEVAKLLLNDDRFRVAEVDLQPGESIPDHDGINRIIYSLSDYTIQYESDKDGKSETNFSTGDVHWHVACEHSVQNIGETNANYLVVSFKE